MDNSYLNQVLNAQLSDFLNTKVAVARLVNLQPHISSSDISVISGVRRCGKSTLLRQVCFNYPDHIILYLDLEDPRLNTFNNEDFAACDDHWATIISNSRSSCAKDSSKVLLLIDEIQNIPGWERWARYFCEKKNYKVYITGSNSEMLSSELGSVLGGRYTKVELFPFSIEEISQHFLGSVESQPATTTLYSQLHALVSAASVFGFFPKPYLEKNPSIYPQLFEDIVNRDIARRKKIRDSTALFNFSTLCAKDNTRLCNMRATSELLRFKDQRTLTSYSAYCEQAYLMFRVRRFSRSLRHSIRGLSKFYYIDPIMADSIVATQTRLPQFLENVVMLHLRRLGVTFGYWISSNGYEVDFVTQSKDDQLEAIQVSYDISTGGVTLERELRALHAARTELHVQNLKLVTMRQVSPEIRNMIPPEVKVQCLLEFLGVWKG